MKYNRSTAAKAYKHRLSGSIRFRVISTYLFISLVGHTLWEIGHLPLYTLWAEESLAKKSLYLFHCTIGDLMIAFFSLGLAVLIAGFRKWPIHRYLPVGILTLVFGMSYTVFSESLNVNVRGSWAYSDAMPLVPPFDTGLTPLLQWFIIPLISLFVAAKTRSAASVQRKV